MLSAVQPAKLDAILTQLYLEPEGKRLERQRLYGTLADAATDVRAVVAQLDRGNLHPAYVVQAEDLIPLEPLAARADARLLSVCRGRDTRTPPSVLACLWVVRLVLPTTPRSSTSSGWTGGCRGPGMERVPPCWWPSDSWRRCRQGLGWPYLAPSSLDRLSGSGWKRPSCLRACARSEKLVVGPTGGSNVVFICTT